jgi:hypothetical protein
MVVATNRRRWESRSFARLREFFQDELLVCRRNIEVVTASFDLAPQLVIGHRTHRDGSRQVARKYAELPPISPS